MSTRKDFLAASAALGALAPQVAMADPSPAPSPSATPVPLPHLDFKLDAFDTALSKGVRHKHLFTSRKIESGEVFDTMEGTLFAYNAIDHPLSDVALAAVFYHGYTVYYAFDDTIWTKYVIPLLPTDKSKSDTRFADLLTADAKTGNPSLHATGDEDDSSIEALAKQTNLHLFACNRAVGGLVHYVARQLKADPVEVYHEFSAHLVPNAMLVPSGVWAVHAVQEHGYTLLPVN